MGIGGGRARSCKTMDESSRSGTTVSEGVRVRNRQVLPLPSLTVTCWTNFDLSDSNISD